MSNRVSLSRWLSFILRHQPESIGLTLDEEGWADVADLILRGQRHGIEIDYERLTQVVAENDKQRFRWNEDGSKIRANQGHSRPVDLGLAPQMPPPVLFHGTAQRFWSAIQTQGILPRSRQFVHLSQDYDTAYTVGKRHGKPLVLLVDAQGLAASGTPFFLSDNGVWLVSQVPPTYLSLGNPP
jgi:putative RNA 2'-phosphotransferase